MKQVLQHLRTGEMEIADHPCPRVKPGHLLIQTQASLISAGTERMLVEFSQANLLQKAQQQPERVKQVLDKMRTDGVLPTLDVVFRKLDEPLPLGYCNAGVVLEVGAGIHDIRPGDRVVSNGAHAEVVRIPRNLCAKIPDDVPIEHAAFTVLSAIALQGIRLAEPTLGERFVVFGMGLLGLLTLQLLQANGCEVLAVDLNSERLELAKSMGAEIVHIGEGGDPIAASHAWTEGRGVDGVLITASAKTDEIMHQAASACRKRGRIILVGVVGLNLRRSDFFAKEITFQVSCSYGPGRYDEDYEQRGRDYPYGYVRWTEQRNFEAVLQLMKAQRLQVEPMITHRYALEDALQAYDKVQNDPKALGIMLQYKETVDRSASMEVSEKWAPVSKGTINVGLVGPGNFAKSVLLPAIAKTEANIDTISGTNAVTARHAAKKFGARRAVTNNDELLQDPNIDVVFYVVRHDAHARLVCEALEAGKHVFVEKPLALDEEELQRIIQAYRAHPGRALMVGFNRRFSPHIQKVKEWIRGRSEPLCLTMTVNSGMIPPESWVQHPEQGGGRIIGEACHFLDLFVYITGSPIVSVAAMMVGEGVAVREDKMSMVLSFADGSIGTINYFSNGTKSYPKENLEVFSDGRIVRMENFRTTTGYGFRSIRKFRTRRQDKGHNAEVSQFLALLKEGGSSLIPFSQLINVTRASFAAVESARSQRVVSVNLEE